MTGTPTPDTSDEAVERLLKVPGDPAYRAMIRQLRKELTEAREKQRERELALIRHAREGGFGFMVSEEGILNAFNATQKEQG